MVRGIVIFGLCCAIFAVQAESLTTDQRLSRVEAQAGLVADLNQQLNDMKDQMLQINGHLEKVTHELEEMKTTHANLTQMVVELKQALRARVSSTKKESPKIVSIDGGR